jgi:hypothetical protein
MDDMLKGLRYAARTVPLWIGMGLCVAACDVEDDGAPAEEAIDDGQAGGEAVAPAALEQLGCGPHEPPADPPPTAHVDDGPPALTADVAAPASAADFAALTAGATLIKPPGAPSQIVLTSPTAFPLLLDDSKRIFAAAARVGNGKVVAYGHEGYMAALVKGGDALKVTLNAVAWASKSPTPVVGVDASLPALSAALQAAGYQVKTVTPAQLAGIDVYMNRAYTPYSEANYEAIRAFVEAGGGLIVGGQGWSFVPQPGGSILDFPGNRMLRGSGIVITNLNLPVADFPVPTALPSMLLNAGYALDVMIKYTNGAVNLSLADQELGKATVEAALVRLPLVAKEFYDAAATLAASAPVITANTPFVPTNKPVAQLALRIEAKLARERPAPELTAHASSADFPGTVSKDIPRETLDVVIDGTYAGRDARYHYSGPLVPVWRSTGAYAMPGELIKVKIPPALASAGLRVQIGQHTDLLWHKTPYVRFPEIVRSQPLNAAEVVAASAFGGPVYILVPGGFKLGDVPVTVENVVRAPRYIHGETTPAEWLTIRDYPAPWAELQTEKIILMLPSSYIKGLADPAPVMDAWDAMMDAQADLGAIPHDRVRPERYLIDRDISAGYMHSGYPIMAGYTEAANLVSVQAVSTTAWGFYHEVGHNHQWSGWFLNGTTETTVNLFSVYTAEEVFGVPRAQAHTSLKPAQRAQRVQTYAAQGKNYATWGSDPWLALEMYLRLQESFGWDFYKSVFGDIQALTPAQTPATDQGRIDLLTVSIAKEVGKNLGPYFKDGWGVPVSQAALDQMAALPVWNNHCASAVVPGAFGQVQGPWSLASGADEHWFVFDAPASAVGKKVRVVTSAGEPATNTVVEVRAGECGVQKSLGGPSNDLNVHENWLSTAITAAGKIFVRVTYSNQGYVDDQYLLTVTLE